MWLAVIAVSSHDTVDIQRKIQDGKNDVDDFGCT